MGARIEATDGRLPPFTVHGARLHSISYDLPVASAQVKSCTMLAALAADGATTITEPAPSRDHTERMLARRRRHGAPQRQARDRRQRRRADARGDRRPRRHELGRVRDRGGRARRGLAICSCATCNVNHTRIGFVRIVQRMGGIVLGELEEDPGDELPATEPVEDLDVAAGPLVGTTVEADEVPLAIDELPLVALLGLLRRGRDGRPRRARSCGSRSPTGSPTVVDGLRGLGGEIEATAGRLRRDAAPAACAAA